MFLRQAFSRGVAAAVLLASSSLFAQDAIRYSATTHVFRIDTPAVTYAMGVNSRGELQAIYWGAAVAASDPIPAPVETQELSGMEPSSTVTPMNFVRGEA